MPTTGRNLSLYFHVTFCRKKCPYCHFYSIYFKKYLIDVYVEGILKHLEKSKKLFEKRTIKSIYFGGGTPTLIGHAGIKTILNAIKPFDENIEITIETNPEDVSVDKIKSFKNVGINRVSVGVQSFDDSLLKILDRNHNAKKAIDAIFDIRQAGIENISIDLMYDIPKQSSQSFKNSLDVVKTLPIEHISLYNLTFEENTLFFREKEKYKKSLPEEELSLDFLELAVKSFEKMGFSRYEISAFSKKNRRSTHNIGYWTAREFLGFGPSAFSYFEGKRFKNISNLQKYVSSLKENKKSVDFSEELSYPKNVNELLVINLRLIEGIDIVEFEKKVAKIPSKTLAELKKSPFVEFKNNKIFLNKKGLLFYDSLASEII